MTEAHQFIVDRHEGEMSIVEVDGKTFVDLPRWFLPRATTGDDVLAVTVEANEDRAVVTVARDAAASARARAQAKAAVERLKRRDPGGDLTL